MDERELADRPADVTLSVPELLAKGYRPYRRYELTLRGDGGAAKQTRDILVAGKVVAVLPVDLARNEIVLLRQFRLPAHLATGKGDMIEIVAGRVEEKEAPAEAARRECVEEIGVAADSSSFTSAGGPLTMFFTDLERSSSAWNEHPDDMVSVLAQHDDLLRQCVERADGHRFDGAMVSSAPVVVRPRGGPQSPGRSPRA